MNNYLFSNFLRSNTIWLLVFSFFYAKFSYSLEAQVDDHTMIDTVSDEYIVSDIQTAWGSLNSSDAWITETTTSFNNLKHTNLQLDTLYADFENQYFKGIGAHISFYNDLDRSLYASASFLSGNYQNSKELAVIGIQNFNQFSIGSKLGYASIKYDQNVPFIDTDITKAFGELFVESYINERTRLNLSYEHRFTLNALRLEAERMSSIENLSFFANLQLASNDYDHAIVGIRYQFGTGSSKNANAKKAPSLRKKRTLSNIVRNTLFGVGVYGAKYNRLGNEYARANNLDASFNNYGVEIENVGNTNPEVVIIIGDEIINDDIDVEP